MILFFLNMYMCAFLNLSKCIVVIFVSFTQMASQVAYPQPPSLVQGALNSTNVCYEACGEVELLATIANRANEILKVGGTHDYVNMLLLAQLPIIHMPWPSLSSRMLVDHHLAA